MKRQLALKTLHAVLAAASVSTPAFANPNPVATVAVNSEEATGPAGAEAEEPRAWRITARLGVGRLTEAVAYKVDEVNIEESQAFWHTRLAAGFQLPLSHVFRRASNKLKATSELCFDGNLDRGYRSAGLSQEISYVFGEGWLVASTGVSLALWFNASKPAQSFATVGLPLSLGFGPVALLYTPGIGLPLSEEETHYPSMTRTRGVSLAPILVDFAVRIGF